MGGQSRPPLQRVLKTTRVRRKIAASPVSHRGGPMGASAPTNNHEKSTNFEGGQGRPPLQMKFDRPVVSSNSVHQISAVPRYFGRKKSSDFANVGRVREIYIPRRRGRCPHRPARNGRFMAVFRRIRVDFPFCTVGADDPVRPPETPVFTENRCEIATFLEGRCGHRPLQITTKNQRISRADRAARLYRQSPYKIHRKEPIPWKKSDRTRYPASWSCCLRRRHRWRP